MKRVWQIGIVIISLVVIGFVGMQVLKYMTKRHSPEETVLHTSGATNFKVFYNRPYKKGRRVFGGLVPFGKVWNVGFDEATLFTTDKDIMIDGTLLKTGTYTLWAIPNPNSWKIIFNSKVYDSGLFGDDSPKYDPKYDVLKVEKPVLPLLNSIAQFSIYFENANGFTLLYLAWDTVAIAIPITAIEGSEL